MFQSCDSEMDEGNIDEIAGFVQGEMQSLHFKHISPILENERKPI